MATTGQVGSPGLSVAILAGGESSRMGDDKALVSLRPGDPPIVRLVIDRVSQLSSELFIVSPPRPQYSQLLVPVLPDLYGQTGVLGAIASALTHSTAERVLITSCDMPFLSVPFLKWMASRSGDFAALVPITSEMRGGNRSSTYQTLHSIYDRRCLGAMVAFLNSGGRAVHSFLDTITIETVAENITRRFDPDLLMFFSVNTPEDLTLARRLVTENETRADNSG